MLAFQATKKNRPEGRLVGQGWSAAYSCAATRRGPLARPLSLFIGPISLHSQCGGNFVRIPADLQHGPDDSSHRHPEMLSPSFELTQVVDVDALAVPRTAVLKRTQSPISWPLVYRSRRAPAASSTLADHAPHDISRRGDRVLQGNVAGQGSGHQILGFSPPCHGTTRGVRCG